MANNNLEMLEAMQHGVSSETYQHNKTLPMQDKLKLPAWECIYALSYKEKKHGKKGNKKRLQSKAD